jgi:hypothetical protein
MYVKLGSDTYLTLCFRVGFRFEFIWNISKPNYFIYINPISRRTFGKVSRLSCKVLQYAGSTFISRRQFSVEFRSMVLQ